MMFSDKKFKKRKKTFPIHTPKSKEEYYYRSIFEEHFPSDTAAKSVPSVPSVACSSAEALEWDETFKNQFQYYLEKYVGRPSPLILAERITKDLGGAKIYIKSVIITNTIF